MGRKHYQPKTRRRGSDTLPPKRNARLSRDTGGRCAFRRSSCLSYGREHPVSRVLSWVAIYLKSALRRSLRDRTRGSAGSLVPSYSVLLRTGFAWRGNRFPPGGLLPTFSPLPWKGGMSLWHFPLVCTNWVLPSVLPCGARTFLPPGRRAATKDTP